MEPVTIKRSGTALLLLLLCTLAGAHAGGENSAAEERMNVLFLVVDDLRPALGVYGYPGVSTPHIDRFATDGGVVFERAYCQQAVCAPSRTSFLTGRRPDTTRLYDFYSYWRQAAGNFTTLPQHFKENGYFAASIGKVFHPGIASNHTDDYPLSWSVPAYHPPTQKYKEAKVCSGPDSKLHMNLLCPIRNISAMPGGSLPDIQSSDYAVSLLRQIAKGPGDRTRSMLPTGDPVPREPFFVGVGFHKPHVPFKFPAEYLDLYPLDKIAPPSDPNLPLGMPPVAYEPWTSLRRREDVIALNASFPYGPLPADFQLKIRQHYHAAASYTDAMLGKVLDELDALGLRNRTIVTLIGDHGWALGEHAEWAKFNNFEVGVRVPLIVRVPGVTDSREELAAPRFVSEFVELVDVFPTVADLAGLPTPSTCPEDSSNVLLCTEGASFAPLLKPALGEDAAPQKWKSAAFSQYPRPADQPQENSDLPHLANITVMGYSMRTLQYRYTRWMAFDNTAFRANWSDVRGEELYAHAGSHGDETGEDKNLAGDSGFADVVAELADKLRRGWRAALPPAP
ncbi:iduronate 2-sulfatase-like [Sycon ciliatum]|uniref:iduronate 2-sulfatase-like n=1 Tax=Sycon ciliatum TaxID=27933 RepID=UPI0031F63086|eukprot:scpid42802/ scgid6837/ Iduronate 2-sulfatase; Alpha-L-iduronate sulfate sulfatase